MYKKQEIKKTTIKTDYTVEGETIENKVRRITLNNEPIKDGAPLIYTDRKEGVQAGYNVRTDRFEVAVEATDKVSKSVQAKRDARAQMNVVKEDQGGQSIQGTEGTNQ